MRCAALAVKTCVALGTACLLAGLAGCTLSSRGHQGDPSVPLTEHVAPSLFVAVVPGPALPTNATGQVLSGVMAASARPGEDVEILRAGTKPTVLVVADSPPPATVTIPGKPTAPNAGATSYQEAIYQNDLKLWERRLQPEGAPSSPVKTLLCTSTNGLGIAKRVSESPAAETGSGSLASECAAADSVCPACRKWTGVSSEPSHDHVFANSLADVRALCELNGDDVIVVTTFLPSAVTASEIQADLLSVGAAWTIVLVRRQLPPSSPSSSASAWTRS